jgi:hypothetical protein
VGGRGTKIKTKVILHTRYVSTYVGAGGGKGRETKIKTKANRCGACYYSIMLDAHRVTSMADTDIDAVKKRKNAERIKQYRLKRKVANFYRNRIT